MISLHTKQTGITLLEVLVGFVIFTTSLVAVLEYVSGQVYLYHLSSDNLQKTQLLYELSSTIGINQNKQITTGVEFNNLDWSVNSTELDVTSQRNEVVQLNSINFSIMKNNQVLQWTVLKIN